MLLDKSSDVVLGFKPNKNITRTDTNEKMRDVAECWEFSTNARTYTSYRDPWDRVELSFMPPESAIIDKTGLTADGAPLICNHIEYRYTKNEDYLDILQKLVNKETGDLLVSLEDNETIKEAACRELKEETGYIAKEIIPLAKYFQDSGCSAAFNYSFLALGCTKIASQNLDKDEFVKYFECTFEEALELIDLGYINGANPIIAFEKAKQYLAR